MGALRTMLVSGSLLLRLAAAGAPPARESQFHIPQCFVQPLWEPLVAAATRRLEWSHAMHALYPAGARAAVRQWLLLARCRSLPGVVRLDPHLTHHIVRLLMTAP